MKTQPIKCPHCNYYTANLEVRYTNIDGDWEPICSRCQQEHEAQGQEVIDHEMKYFGGAYGLPSWETRPIQASIAPNPQLVSGTVDVLAAVDKEIEGWRNVCANPASKPFHIRQAEEQLDFLKTIRQALAQAGVPDGYALVKLGRYKPNPFSPVTYIEKIGDRVRVDCRGDEGSYSFALPCAPVSAKEG